MTHAKTCNRMIEIHGNTCVKKEGENVKVNRKKLELAMATACMNTEDLQKASNIPRATLNNVISGRNVRPGTMGKVAKGLGVCVTEIIED